MNFICAISASFPENYRIGVEACTWGVEEKYEKNIRKTSPGDRLIFVVGGQVRSVHLITSEVYNDETPLWPMKGMSLFPYRIKIGEPLYVGAAALADLAASISFMKGKHWPGTLQGPHGVFNDRSTDADFELIRQRLTKPVKPLRYAPSRARMPKESPSRTRPMLGIGEHALRDALERAVESRGWHRSLEVEQKLNTAISGDDGAIPCTFFDAASGTYIAADFHLESLAEGALLQILRRMSWIRQNIPTAKNIRGEIISDEVDSILEQVISEIENVTLSRYRVAIELESPEFPSPHQPGRFISLGAT